VHVIGRPGLCKVHFIHKTLRELFLLSFTGDYFTLILIMLIFLFYAVGYSWSRKGDLL